MTDTAFSNSYIETDAELEALIGSDPRPSAVALKAATAAVQEWYCQESTRHIEEIPLRGFKYDRKQDRAFPRIIDDVIVGDENQIAVVPDSVKRACVEEAIAIYREESAGGGRAALQAAGVQSYSIGGKLQETFRPGAGSETVRSLRARQILQRYAGAEVR